MTVWTEITVLVIVVVTGVFAAAKAGAARVTPDDPQAYSRTQSLGDLLNSSAAAPVHILYVHGMAATESNNSKQFREALANHLKSVQQLEGAGARELVTRMLFQSEPWPAHAAINGLPIWNTEKEWDASKPFIERYTFHRVGKSDVVLDDINWWPLLFALKCRFILNSDADLAGADRERLKLCARSDPPYYPWLSGQQLKELLAARPRAGRGAVLNDVIKRGIMNWGLSDAAMAMGPMRGYFRKAMNEAFEYANQSSDASPSGSEFVVVSASLGSFVALDAMINSGEAGLKVASQNSLLYFFANQFALLDLARVEGLPNNSEFQSLGLAEVDSPKNLLKAWAGLAPRGLDAVRAKQILAYSDPSDILTYRVPAIDGATVVNLYDRNEISWFSLFADPTKAHTGHSTNSAVLSSMFERHTR